jgi:hypothetical protein
LNAKRSSKTPRPRLRRILTIIGGVVAGLAGLAAVGVFLFTVKWWPFQEPGAAELATRYDNTNPARECAQTPGVANLTTIVIHDSSEADIASVEVRHSPECQTAWLRVTSAITGVTVEKAIERPATDDLPAGSVLTADDVTDDPETAISFSDQLYAPGCIEFAVTVLDLSGKVVGQVEDSAGC